MIPTFFVSMDELPLTPNGKIDRKALPEPEDQGGSVIPPRNGMETRMAEIWADILDVEKESVSIDDNFFQRGGHSLKATQLLARIHKEFDVKVTLAEIFQKPRLDDLTLYVKGMEADTFEAIEPAPAQKNYPLTSGQKRLYVLQQLTPDSTGYNLPQFFPLPRELSDGFSMEKMEDAFRALIGRHESLRTSFTLVEEEPRQVIHEAVEFAIQCHEAVPDVGSTIGEFVSPFDLAQAPLMRAGLVKNSGSGPDVLMVDMHHIISDALSHEILVRDFLALYEGETLAPLRLQYKDFTWWQLHRTDAREAQESAAKFWLEQFPEEPPVLELPTDFTRPAVQSFEGSTIRFDLGKQETAALNELARQHGATLYMVLLSITTAWLSRLSRGEDICIGTPVAGRSHEDLNNIIGLFVNTLVLRNFPNGDKPFTAFLDEVKDRTIAAFERQEYPFEELVNRVVVKRDTGRNPLFDVMFTFLGLDSPEAETPPQSPPAEEAQGEGFQNPTSKFDLSLNGLETGGRLLLAVEYCTRLFKEERIRQFIAYFKQLTAAVIANPKTALSEMDILTEAEREQILRHFNDTDAPFQENITLHALFERQAQMKPGNKALMGASLYDGKSDPPQERGVMTYEELNLAANRLACHLKARGVKAGNIVALMLERSREMIIAIMAILKAGSAYLPIDVHYPPERVAYLLKDSNAAALLSAGSLLKETDYEITTIDISTLYESPSTAPTEELRADLPSTSLAYIIYTSGSTGKPKGVMIEHRPAVNRLSWMQNRYPLGDNDVILQKTPYVFDVSVWEIFWWSQQGAALSLLRPDDEKNPGTIIDVIEKTGVTTMHFVPSMLNAFLEYMENETVDASRLSSLRQVFASGEALDISQVERFNRLIFQHPEAGAKLINLYGPTEATVDVSYFDCSPTPESGIIPIGKPIENIGLYIIDGYRQFQPIGIPGELCISGVGLARGYLNRPELTAEKFVNDLDDNPRSLYLTGDLAAWQPDGNIRFLGRIDHQVKVRGFRIEPGEIESGLLAHADIDEAVVIALPGPFGDHVLCAYFVARQELDTPALRAHLGENLPDYMIPSFFVQMEKMPLTPNGKLNRAALPAPQDNIKSGVDFAAPTNETETKLLEIWQEVLSLENIGIDDDYFVLGGDSIRAITLFSKTKKAFPDLKFVLIDLFRNATIRKFASHLSTLREGGESADVQRYGILQPLTPLTEEQTISLVCVPYAGGSSATYIRLARQMAETDPNIAIYTVAVPGNDIGSPVRHKKPVKEIAAQALEKIQEHIKTPIVLYGHCVGAALTVELARQVEEADLDLKYVGLGGALYAPALLERDSDMWKGRSNEEIRDLLVEWGAFKKGEMASGDLIFILRNFRKDVKNAVDYYKLADKEKGRKKLKAPIYNLVTKNDPLTQGYRMGYRKWKSFSGTVKLIVIEEGDHYFINDRAPLVSSILLDLNAEKETFYDMEGVERKRKFI